MLVKSLVSTAVPLSRRVLAINAPCLSAVPRRFIKITEFNKPVHMDELTWPCECWQEHYDNKQRKYNVILFSSIGFFLISAFALFGTDSVNWCLVYPDPPRRK